MANAVKDKARRIQAGYADGAARPLGGYLAAMGAYGGLVGGLAGAGRLLGAKLPRRLGAADTALLGAATFKASRLLAKDAVTSPLRAPFTKFEESAGQDELNESVPGRGHLEHTLGELLSCPFCLNVWVGTGLAGGFVLAPRVTRFAASALTAFGLADFLHLLYDAGKKLAG